MPEMPGERNLKPMQRRQIKPSTLRHSSFSPLAKLALLVGLFAALAVSLPAAPPDRSGDDPGLGLADDPPADAGTGNDFLEADSAPPVKARGIPTRSEEHTSELQSRPHL